RQEPVHEQRQSERERESREAIEDGRRQGVLELVHRQVRRQRPRRHTLKIDAAAVLFPVPETRGLGSRAATELVRPWLVRAWRVRPWVGRLGGAWGERHLGDQ